MKTLSLAILLFPTLLLAQPQPLPAEKKTFIDSVGHYYQQASLPVYLFISNSPDGRTVPLQKAGITLEGHGVHTFKHENHITQGFDEIQIYADGIAPVSVASFLHAPTYQTDRRQFYGAGLVVTLVAKDEMSGVEQIYQSVNKNGFERYAQKAFTEEGRYDYHYYAVDKTGNAEVVKTKSFVVDLSAPVTYHNFIGISSENVISTNSSIYLTITDTLSGVAKTHYKFDRENYRIYPGGNIPFQYLADGDHVLTYYSVDNVTNKEVEKSMKFYLDKTAPIMSADVLGDKFIVGEKVYFSGRTKLKLTAVDNKSGIKEVMYSINNDPFIKYQDPFYLPNRSGIHNVRFYANDNTSNNARDDFQHGVGVIYVDLTGPSLEHSFIGPTFTKADTVFISPKTTINLKAQDPEAGLKKIAYSLDGALDETTFTKPINVTKDGLHTLAYYGYDNVNNKNARETLFITDSNGPAVTYKFSSAANKEGKYPSYSTVYLAAEDKEVGADQIKYSINGAKEQLYVAPLKGFVKNKEYTIKVTAIDMLGNSSTSEIKFKTDKY